MAETLTEKQERITLEIQQTLTELLPNLDFSIGTVLYELVVKPAAVTYAGQESALDTLRDNMSLVQVLNQTTPDPVLVDNLLSNFNVTRREGLLATGLLNIYTNATQPVNIPQSAVFTCAGVNMRPTKTFVGVIGEITNEDTATISYIQAREYGRGLYVFPISVVTTQPTATVLSTGQACTTTITNSFIKKIDVASTISGGSVEETTVQLLERAATSINAKVLTGRDNIRSFLSSNETVTVLDTAVFGMGDPLQIRDTAESGQLSVGGHVDAYVKTGPVPTTVTTTLTGTRDADSIWTIIIPEDTYPGAYGVTRITYNGDLVSGGINHVLGFFTEESAPLMTEQAHARYSMYQTMSVQFRADDIPSAVTSATFIVDVLYMPGVAALQAMVQDDSVRSYSFDMLIKAAIPILVAVSVDLEYPRGFAPPTATQMQRAISDVINLKAIGTTELAASDVIYAIKLLFPEALVKMPINMFGRVFLPDGTQAYGTDHNKLTAPVDTGISYENCAFFCFPANVEVSFTEV